MLKKQQRKESIFYANLTPRVASAMNPSVRTYVCAKLVAGGQV